jgi:hypothetical protein
MHWIRLAFISLFSFLFVTSGAFFKKSIALLLCGVFTLNALTCSAQIDNGSQAIAAVPPSTNKVSADESLEESDVELIGQIPRARVRNQPFPSNNPQQLEPNFQLTPQLEQREPVINESNEFVNTALQETLFFISQIDHRFTNLLNSGLAVEQAVNEVRVFLESSSNAGQVISESVVSTTDGGLAWLHQSGIPVFLDPDMYSTELNISRNSSNENLIAQAYYLEDDLEVNDKSIQFEMSNKLNENSDQINPDESIVLATGNILVLSPFAWENLIGKFDLDESVMAKLRAEFGSKVDHKRNTVRDNPTISWNDFTDLEGYGVITISTHGSIVNIPGISDSEKPGFINTGIKANSVELGKFENFSRKPLDLNLIRQSGERSFQNFLKSTFGVTTKGTFSIGPEFVRKYVELSASNHPLVYLNSCEVLATSSLAQAFREKGAETVIGYTILAFVGSYLSSSTQVFDELLDGTKVGELSLFNTGIRGYPSGTFDIFRSHRGDFRGFGNPNLVIISRNSSDPPRPEHLPEPSRSPGTGNKKKGTSYGDPHLITFDGHRYSFQTVGEYILAKSTDGYFQVQTRQSPVNRNLSLNSAVAMQVGSDRVAFYSKDFPDSDTTTPLRVNAAPTTIQGESLSLPGGGIIYKKSDSDYVVQWNTGEQVAVNIYQRGQYNYMDIFPFVFESQAGQIVGLLGNADGNPDNDLRFRSGNLLPTKSTYGDLNQIINNIAPVQIPLGELEKLYFQQLNRDFGSSWRVTPEESLFDYAPGQTTDSFTDRAFPDAYLTLDMLPPDALQAARSACSQAGVDSSLMEGCIFDVGFTGYSEFAYRASQVSNILDVVESVIPGFQNPIPEIIRHIPRIPGLNF